MNAQSNHLMHTRALAQSESRDARTKKLEADLFAAGERSGEARGFRKGLACSALLAVFGFVAGLILSVLIVPMVVWWLA